MDAVLEDAYAATSAQTRLPVTRQVDSQPSEDPEWSNLPRTPHATWLMFTRKPHAVDAEKLFRNVVLNPHDRYISASDRQSFVVMHGEYSSRLNRLGNLAGEQRKALVDRLISGGSLKPIDFEVFARRSYQIKVPGKTYEITGARLVEQHEKRLRRLNPNQPDEYYRSESRNMAYRYVFMKDGDAWTSVNGKPYHIAAAVFETENSYTDNALDFLSSDMITAVVMRFSDWGILPAAGQLLELVLLERSTRHPKRN